MCLAFETSSNKLTPSPLPMSSSPLPLSTSNESSNTTTTSTRTSSSSTNSSSSENHKKKKKNNNHLPPKQINKNNKNTNKLLLLETSTTHSMSSSDCSSHSSSTHSSSSSTVDVCNDGNDYKDEEQDDLLLLLQPSLTLTTTSSTSTTTTPCTDLGQEHEQQACPSLVTESISNVSSINSDEDCSIIDSPPLILAADVDADTDAASPRSATTYKRQQPTKKCVQFSEKEPEIITGSSSIKPSSCMTQEERAELYWQLQDYEYFRGTARIIASEILKLSSSSAQQKQQQQQSGSHSYDAVLTRAHQYCCSQQQQQQQQQPWQQNDKEELEKDKDGDIFLLVPPNLFEALTQWIRAGHSRRGLEKFCIPHHMQIRPLERKAGVDAVLIAQELLQKARNNNNNDAATAATATAASNQHHGEMFHFGKWHFSLDDMSNEEILRILSERFSASSRKFATVMGHADAAAVGNYQYSS